MTLSGRGGRTAVAPADMGPSPLGGPGHGKRRVAIVVTVMAVIAAAIVVLVIGATRGDRIRPRLTNPTTAAPTETTAVAPADASTAVWPFAVSETRYTDPVAAATGFVVDYLGFTAPLIGAFQPGDSRSGEVETRPRSNGPLTTVFVRELGADGTWWVLGAATADIQVHEPAALTAISSPVTLAGVSTAFEATVSVEIRQDGALGPLTSGWVMGGSMGEMGPFRDEFTFPPPAAASGAIVLYTVSMEDGQIWEASVLRVHFAPVTGSSG